MKKITALIAALAVVLTLAACKPGATEQSATPAPTQTSEQEKTVAMKKRSGQPEKLAPEWYW